MWEEWPSSSGQDEGRFSARWVTHHISLHQDLFNGDIMSRLLSVANNRKKIKTQKFDPLYVLSTVVEFYYLLLRKSLWDGYYDYQHFMGVETHSGK